MPPETFGATSVPLFELPPVERNQYAALAEIECERVRRLVLEMSADPLTWTGWRDLHAACVAAEVMVHVARMQAGA